MAPYKNSEVENILKKYSSKIESQIKTSDTSDVNYSREYTKFKQEMAPELTKYERWCQSLGKVIKLNIAKKDEEKIKKNLEIAHLDLEAWQPLTLSVMVFLAVFGLGLIVSIAIALIGGGISEFPFLFYKRISRKARK